MRFLLAVALLLMSTRAWSCSCFGTSSIEETIATHPNLVEARVLSTSDSEATLRVTRVLKERIGDCSATVSIRTSCAGARLPK